MIVIRYMIMTMMLMVLITKDPAFDDYDDNDSEKESAEIVFETNGVNKKNKAEKLRGWQNN